MSYLYSIVTEDTGWTVVDYGPMHLRIFASRTGERDSAIVREAAEASLEDLDGVANCKAILRLPHGRIQSLPDSQVAVRMIESVRAVGDSDLTPMAAVAGTLADFTADRLERSGMTKVIVDNGGDIAVRLAPGESVNMGVRPDVRSPGITHILRLDAGMRSWGVTTSGFGGRSFTRGIASAVTVAAKNGSLADAAATAIANACFVDDEQIVQLPAELLDPETDIAGIPVTVRIGALPAPKVESAIRSACQKAQTLVEKGVIFGALVNAGGLFSMTRSMESILAEG